jgi:murein biosynthesis integral membrane protein MurJ
MLQLLFLVGTHQTRNDSDCETILNMSQNLQSLEVTDAGLMAAHLKSANKHILRALLSISSAIFLIRVMGMINQIIVSARFGAGATMDAYLVAYLLPVTIAQLAIGTIENTVIPAYARIRITGTKKQASLLLSTLLNLLLIGGSLLTLLMFIFRRQVIFITAPALDPVRMNLAVGLTPFILPVLLLMSLIGFLECIFNAEEQFGWPAYAGILVPLSTAILVLVFSKSLGVVMLCVGMVVGLCLQLGVFIIRARRANLVYRPVIDLRLPELSLILLAAWPALLGSIISQISPIVDQIFTSFLPVGSISALNYALKLISVPTGVIALSIGRAAVPYFSLQVAMNDIKAFKESLRFYMWIMGIGTALLSVFMLVLAHPIVQVLFQRGQFSAADTDRTAATLIGFVVGLAPMTLLFIVVRAFSALRRTQVLFLISIANVVLNAVFDYIFGRLWQSQGIALATSAMYFCTFLILIFTLRCMIGKLDLFTPPPELLSVVEKLRMNKYYPRGFTNFVSNGIPYSFVRQITRISLILMVFAAGIVGTVLNSLYTLRIAVGSVLILVLLRYPYILLITWVLGTTGTGFDPILENNNLFTGLTLASLLLMTGIPIRKSFKHMPALAFLFLFALWVFASIGISPLSIGTFLTSWTDYLIYVVIAILTINLLNTKQRVMGLIDAILLISSLIALYGIYGYFTQQFGNPDPEIGFRITSTFGSSPALGLFLSLGIPLGFYRMLTLSGFKRITSLVVILILLVALGMSLARAAFIGVFLSILIMSLFHPSQKMRVGLLSGLLALPVLALISGLPVFYRFFQSDITTLDGRTGLWQILLARFDPTQLLGHGLGASSLLLASLSVNDVRLQKVTSYEPHNLFVAVLYDHGIIGLSLLLLTFIALFAGLIVGMRKATGSHRMLCVTALAILVSVYIQSFGAVDLLFVEIGLYFWIIMALPFALFWSAPKEQPETSKEVLNNHETMIFPMQTVPETEREQISTGSVS